MTIFILDMQHASRKSHSCETQLTMDTLNIISNLSPYMLTLVLKVRFDYSKFML